MTENCYVHGRCQNMVEGHPSPAEKVAMRLPANLKHSHREYDSTSLNTNRHITASSSKALDPRVLIERIRNLIEERNAEEHDALSPVQGPVEQSQK